jgi:hypothetical protein
VLIIFQIFCLPFLQWNSTFSAHAPHMISQPIDQFLPCCCRCLPIKQQCKKNGEKPLCFFIAQSFYSPFLSNCCLWGEHVICGCHGNCGWDNCSSCSAATAAAATVAVATEATAAAATLAAVMVAPAMATIFAQLLPLLQCIAQACRALQKEQWSINGESEVFALSQSFGRTTKDNGCDELGDNCNGGCAGLQT